MKNLSLEELLNVLITTASRSDERWVDAPARVEVVTAEQITRRGYRSLAEVLKDLPDFKVEIGVQPDFPTDVTVQGIRGSNRIILLLDGIRISSPTNEPLPIVANYPVHNARQIEIVYGPGSALYGADAFSAVINIISKTASETKGVTVGSAVGQFGLVNLTGSYGVAWGKDRGLVIAAQSLYDRQPDLSKYYPDDFGGLAAQHSGIFPTIFGPMTASGPISPNYHIPLTGSSFQAVLQADGFQVSLFRNQERISTSPAYTPDNAIYSDGPFNKNVLLVVSGSYARKVGRITSTSTVMSSRHELDPESGYENVFSGMQRSYKYAYGSELKGDQQLSWTAGRARFTAGGTVERFFSIPQGADLNARIRSRGEPGTILGTNITDDFIKIREANAGVYGQVQQPVTPSLTLTLGARADRHSRYGSTFNPRLGLVWHSPSRATLKLLYGTAFLAPSPYEAYSHYGTFFTDDGGRSYTSAFWHLPNPDLRPQYKRTFELNLRQPLTDQVAVTGTAFYSRLTDLIRERPDLSARYAGTFHGWPVDYVELSVNGGRAAAYGGTAALDALKTFSGDRKVAGRVALSVTDGRTVSPDGQRLPLGGFAPVQFHVGADVDWGRWQMAPRLTASGQQRVLATQNTGGRVVRRTLDGYATWDVNIRRQRLFKNLDAYVTIENALDQRYRSINLRAYNNPEELIGAPQNPRRVTIGVAMRLP